MGISSSNSKLLIVSNANDISTNDVLDWLYYWKVENIERINCDSTIIEDVSILIESENSPRMELRINNEILKVGNDHRYWYRRGDMGKLISTSCKAMTYAQRYQKKLAHLINDNIKREQSVVIAYLNYNLEKRGLDSINKFSQNVTSKIENLGISQAMGLKIPDTLITNSRSKLMEFLAKYENVITKDILFNTMTLEYDDEKMIEIQFPPTLLIVDDIVKSKMEILNKSKNIGVGFFQQYISKKYELRIFYLKGKFFSMAIFSQQNEKTKIDFRNYDEGCPNRCVPYILPQEIEQKLGHFMEAIDMNCGSIDMIYTPEGEYIFLEVNPVGQYQWLERNCNYPISKSIAETLSTNIIND